MTIPRLFLIAIFLILCVCIISGCTLKFKATDVELDGGMSGTLKLDGFDVLGVPVCRLSPPDLVENCCFTGKFYAKNSQKTR